VPNLSDAAGTDEFLDEILADLDGLLDGLRGDGLIAPAVDRLGSNDDAAFAVSPDSARADDDRPHDPDALLSTAAQLERLLNEPPSPDDSEDELPSPVLRALVQDGREAPPPSSEDKSPASNMLRGGTVPGTLKVDKDAGSEKRALGDVPVYQTGRRYELSRGGSVHLEMHYLSYPSLVQSRPRDNEPSVGSNRRSRSNDRNRGPFGADPNVINVARFHSGPSRGNYMPERVPIPPEVARLNLVLTELAAVRARLSADMEENERARRRRWRSRDRERAREARREQERQEELERERTLSMDDDVLDLRLGLYEPIRAPASQDDPRRARLFSHNEMLSVLQQRATDLQMEMEPFRGSDGANARPSAAPIQRSATATISRLPSRRGMGPFYSTDPERFMPVRRSASAAGGSSSVGSSEPAMLPFSSDEMLREEKRLELIVDPPQDHTTIPHPFILASVLGSNELMSQLIDLVI